MYQDEKRKHWILLLLIVVLLGLAGRFFLSTKTRTDVNEETAASIKQAVEQAALQCYVIEGAYPETLDYLTSNYGLRVNTKDYVVVYQAAAENRIPDIRVVRREQ